MMNTDSSPERRSNVDLRIVNTIFITMYFGKIVLQISHFQFLDDVIQSSRQLRCTYSMDPLQLQQEVKSSSALLPSRHILHESGSILSYVRKYLQTTLRLEVMRRQNLTSIDYSLVHCGCPKANIVPVKGPLNQRTHHAFKTVLYTIRITSRFIINFSACRPSMDAATDISCSIKTAKMSRTILKVNIDALLFIYPAN